jgi:hypothetical protein
MAGTFRDHKARVALSHMAQVWLALADRHQDGTRVSLQQQQQLQPQKRKCRPLGCEQPAPGKAEQDEDV